MENDQEQPDAEIESDMACAIAQAVSRRLPMEVARIQDQDKSIMRSVVAREALGRFSPSTLVFLPIIICHTELAH